HPPRSTLFPYTTLFRSYEVLPGKLEVKQAGTISDPSTFVFNGAIAPTLSGGAVINYNTASASALVQIMAQSRASSDPAGTMNTRSEEHTSELQSLAYLV